ncbi:cohesin domain-containing protein [candidate division KSB1 bacterium]
MGITRRTAPRSDKGSNHVLWVFLTGLLLAWQIACSQGPADPDQRNDVGFLFRMAAAEFEANIRYIILTVTGEGMNPVHQELILEGTTFSGRVEVPAGSDRIFTCLAYNDSHRVIFSAVDTVDLVPGEPFLVELNLIPNFFSLLISPSDTTVSRGNDFPLRIQVYGVEDLFGATLRLEFDPEELEVARVEQGTFLGQETLFFSKVDSNLVILGITRKQGEKGVSGSGRLGTIYFRSLTSQISEISFVEDWIKLIQPDGEDVAGIDSLNIGSSAVTIK